ncbi:MAG: hypothetical protein QOH56_845 [Pseudonocardiales bacterium]|nr:hypothetical protein [Pseudonocardiales bacterium]
MRTILTLTTAAVLLLAGTGTANARPMRPATPRQCIGQTSNGILQPGHHVVGLRVTFGPVPCNPWRPRLNWRHVVYQKPSYQPLRMTNTSHR